MRRNVANLITFGRIPLCMASFTCAVLVLLDSPDKVIYGFVGLFMLIITALTDYFDGLVARRFDMITKLGPLADQMLDKMVYCIIFPTISVGTMAVDGQQNIYHVILCLALCVTMLVRDHYVNFLRVLADRHQGDVSVHQIGKLRTLWALPTSCILYAYCFTRGEAHDLWYLNSLVFWISHVPIRYFMVLEISLFVINVVSAISYTRAYGSFFMKDLCEDDDDMRRRILSIFPNALTCMNAVMGIFAALLAWNGNFHLAFVCLMAAAIFDKLDGAAARKLGLVDDPVSGKQRITIGAILDDIADGISFCIAPAVIAHAYFADFEYAGWVYLYAVGGICRLVFFTLDPKPIPGFFKGLPSPAAALLTGAAVQAADHLADAGSTTMPMFILGTFLFTTLLMNAYFIPYIHFGKLMSQSRLLTHTVFTAMLIAMFSPYLGLFTLFVMGCYLCSPIFVKTSVLHNS